MLQGLSAAYVLIFNAGQQDEGVYTLQGRSSPASAYVLAFERDDDAERFSQLLQAEGFVRVPASPLPARRAAMPNVLDSAWAVPGSGGPACCVSKVVAWQLRGLARRTLLLSIPSLSHRRVRATPSPLHRRTSQRRSVGTWISWQPSALAGSSRYRSCLRAR